MIAVFSRTAEFCCPFDYNDGAIAMLVPKLVSMVTKTLLQIKVL